LVSLLACVIAITATAFIPEPLRAQKNKKHEVSIATGPSQRQVDDDGRKKSDGSTPTDVPIQSATDARAALDQGKALLRRNQADQALGYLETALRLFNQSGNGNGRAAAEDAIGDIYARQGQYNIALRYYQSAYEAFQARNEAINSNLMLAKIGETYFRLGKISEAQLAFARITAKKENDTPSSVILGPNTGATSGVTDSAAGSASQGATAGQSGTMTQVMPNLSPAGSSCPFFNPNIPNVPNQGVAPKKFDDIGRLDLRLLDQNGNPVKGAKAKL